ncbi:hypothetical protein Krad_2583 [Kineococcus radiotolerans SRS30216 = ATCC BAA-149]|uniref:Uncharacterized protein n=1 Tax=Kineococcus radiotolerans (strain ATCC BAA-149 / DSM 14245 / SRS30216) TaxID=266940 RepID=A6WB68_KINRD|nr:hypothetical protein Krad_2583 [Kineococcus radiotolerans SRS30216 = ATCC BAA-149]
MRRRAGDGCCNPITTSRTRVDDWPALQQRIEETSKHRLLTLQGKVRTAGGAGYLADHTADDLVGRSLIVEHFGPAPHRAVHAVRSTSTKAHAAGREAPHQPRATTEVAGAAQLDPPGARGPGRAGTARELRRSTSARGRGQRSSPTASPGPPQRTTSGATMAR